MYTVLVCPICFLPPEKCSFFARIGNLKFDDDPVKSGVLRSRYFRMYHKESQKKKGYANYYEYLPAWYTEEPIHAGAGQDDRP